MQIGIRQQSAQTKSSSGCLRFAHLDFLIYFQILLHANFFSNSALRGDSGRNFRDMPQILNGMLSLGFVWAIPEYWTLLSSHSFCSFCRVLRDIVLLERESSLWTQDLLSRMLLYLALSIYLLNPIGCKTICSMVALPGRRVVFGLCQMSSVRKKAQI